MGKHSLHVAITITVALALVLTSVGSPVAAAPRYSDWSGGTYVSALNTTEFEFANAISKDGLSFYFQRGDATVNGENIWVSHRVSVDDAWQAPVQLSANVNSSFNDRAAYVSQDGHWLYFASDRPGGRGGFDLMVSWRAHVHDETAWGPAVNVDDLGAPLNTAGFDSGPTLFEDDATGTTQMYFVSNPTGPQGGSDVYWTIRNEDGSFRPPTRVAELSTTSNEGRPYIRHDGLEIFFNSNRPGSMSADIWVSTRETTTDVWSAPQLAAGVNTAAGEITPVLSWDGMTLLFASNRAGNAGDIFYATRTKSHGAP